MELIQGQGTGLVNILFSHRYGKGAGLQSGSVATGTGSNSHELLVLLLHFLGKALLISSFHIVEQAFKYHTVHISLSKLGGIAYRNAFRTGTVEDNLPNLLRKLTKWSIQRKAVLFAQSHQHSMGEASFILGIHPAHYGNGTLI